MKIQRIEEITVCVGLSILILLVFTAATLRWFGIDMSWSVDFAQLTFSWVCFIGADLAMRHKRHMGVDILVNRFSLPVRNAIYLFNSILIMFFLVFITYYGANLSIINFQRTFNTLPISYSFVTISAPIGCLLMLYTNTKRLVEYISNIIKHDYRGIIQEDKEGGETI
ncbi:TRAP transporter small permease [Maledivibacter halophilus]|uniref:TRAP-type C4-dicarboxylate transport system, small permease component n=1 Tax=Maledivibacter halophilus TaxID=36842 RepID=A0A1T5M2C9_9FIRM|nr:TRAP transporter small permease [Maledivibacter halophilus]SKC82009.1 TRAP-type C4-dicarboxylate transport system, small permease component [Maledivibacter halophilus]